MRSRQITIVVATLVAFLSSRSASAQQLADPYQWLEDVEAPRSLAWVEAHNKATVSELQAMPIYDTLYRKILTVITNKDRLSLPAIRGKHIVTYWTDAEHPRGYWRRTTAESFLSKSPRWEKVLDVDSLAAADKVKWAWRGSDCLEPEFRYCLVNLSRGGGDAVEVREFDMKTKQFVPNGFFLKEAKSEVSWLDANTLLVGTDFGAGSMTTSGYPRVVKLWKRGTPLTAAKSVFTGDSTDVAVFGGILRVGGRRIPIVGRNPEFFRSIYYEMRGDSLARLGLPERTDIETLGNQLVVLLKEEWTTGGRTLKSGSVVAIDYDKFMKGSRAFTTLLSPTSRSSVQGLSTTKNLLLINTLTNVQGELHWFRNTGAKWVSGRVQAPKLSDIRVAATDDFSDRFFYTITNFLQPASLYYAVGTSAPGLVRQAPSFYNADGLAAEQFEAVSRDGTRIPYFIVHRKDIPLDGKNPTLLYGYGGFAVSYLPSYSGTMGSSWLERGGIYVLANIRGGGEFGPSWHKAAMRENKERSYEDFISVAENLITRNVTTAAHLGIMGGSNGGLLVGAAMTKRPDLFNAVVIQVPLLDMQRYSKLLAGASWMAEYGDPDKPEDWAFISKYSPYHNLRAGVKYPRAMFTTTTRDDRVHPAHARKMAAKMEELGIPFYYFENTEGGHGSGVTPEQTAKTQALTYTYLWKQLR